VNAAGPRAQARRAQRRPGPGRSPAGPRSALGLAMATTVVAATPPFLVGALAVQVAGDLAFSATQLALCVAGYFAVSALLSPAAGRRVLTWGTGTCIVSACTVAAGSLLAVALAWHWTVLLAAMVAAGAGNALVQPACNALVGSRVAVARRGIALGLNQASVPTSTLLCGVLVPAVALTAGWRWCAVSVAVAALLVGRAAGRAELGRPGSRAVSASLLGRRAPLLVLAAAGALAATAATSLPAFLIVSAYTVGFSPVAASSIQVCGSLAAIATRVGFGWAADRRSGHRLATTACLMGAGALGYALMSVAALPAFAVGAVVAFGCGWGWNGLYNIAVSRLYPDAISSATGISQSGIYAGGVLGPLVFGVLAQYGSVGAAWATMSGIAICAASLVLLARLLFLRPGGVLVPATAGTSGPPCVRCCDTGGVTQVL